MLILEIPCFGILRSCTRKEHFVRCPSEYNVDAVIQSPTRLHSLLEVTSRSNLQSSTGQVQHRETHEVCHRGTRSFLLDRPAAITLLGGSHVGGAFRTVDLLSVLAEPLGQPARFWHIP